jgi:hypothetical protein
MEYATCSAGDNALTGEELRKARFTELPCEENEPTNYMDGGEGLPLVANHLQPTIQTVSETKAMYAQILEASARSAAWLRSFEGNSLKNQELAFGCMR